MKEIENKIRLMVGCSYQYKEKLITISDYKIQDNSIKIFTNDGNIVFSLSDAINQLARFTPAPQLVKLHNSQIVVDMMNSSNGYYEKMQNTLLDTIEKVKTDPSYVPQAEAINNSVKQMVDIEKTRIAGLSLICNMSKN